LVGVAFEIAQLVLQDFSRPEIPIFSVFMVGWGILVLIFWRRKEKELSMMWGTAGEDKRTRPVIRDEFQGILMKSHINGDDILYYSPAVLACLGFFAILCTTMLVIITLALVVSLYVIKYQLANTIVGYQAQWATSGITAFLVSIINVFYSQLAIWITNAENHRTEKSYEEALIGVSPSQS